MISAAMLIPSLVRLPFRLAWNGYGILWWAFGDRDKVSEVWAAPSRRLRMCYWLTVASVATSGVGAWMLSQHDLMSGSRAFMTFVWTAAAIAVGSAFVGTRPSRTPPAARPARSVESTLHAAAQLIREGRSAPQDGHPDVTAPHAAAPRAAARRAWTNIRSGSRGAAGVMSAAARSGWAGVKHAASTYRSLRDTHHRAGP